MTFSPIWENIIILSQEFPHYGKIFCFGLAQSCTYTSPPLPLTVLYAIVSVFVSVCVCRQPVFNYSPMTAFQLMTIPRLSLFPLMSHSAQLNFLSHAFFFFTSLFRLFSPSCLPSFHASNLSSSSAPTPNPPLASLSLYIFPNFEVSHLLTSNGCVSPPFPCLLPLPSKLCCTIALPTKRSSLMSGKPVGTRVILLIIAFTGNPHCLALP